MKEALGLAVALSSVALAPINAAPKAVQGVEVCSASSKAIEQAEKQIGDLKYLLTLEDSAPRAATIFAHQSLLMQEIQANLTLMSAARCVLPSQPISEDSYFVAAHTCGDARLRVAQARKQDGPVPAPPECDRRTWEKTPN